MISANELKIKESTYLLSELLGQGAYGKVYKGQNKQTGQIVAIKIQDHISDQELMMLNQMKEKKFKNLINILNFEQINRKYYIVMEYCKESLFERLQSKGTIQAADVRFIMKEIGNGIKEIHDLGYAHRDIKPENVLIFQMTDNGNTQDLYKICDFGTIKKEDVLKTQLIGTAYYLAPEQINGSNQYSNKVDIWAFGALIYELLTGEPMFNGYSEQVVWMKIKQITQQEIDEKINKCLKIERKYRTLLLNMLQIDKDKRFDINQVMSDLRGQSQTKTKQDQANIQIVQQQKVYNEPSNYKKGMVNPNYFFQNQSNINNLPQERAQNQLPEQQKIDITSSQRGRLAASEQNSHNIGHFRSPQNQPKPNFPPSLRVTQIMNTNEKTKSQAPTQILSQSQEQKKFQPVNLQQKQPPFQSQSGMQAIQNTQFQQNNQQKQSSSQPIQCQRLNNTQITQEQTQNQVVSQAFQYPNQQNSYYQPNKQQNNVDNQESIQNQHATQLIHNQQFQQNNTNQQNRFPQNNFIPDKQFQNQVGTQNIQNQQQQQYDQQKQINNQSHQFEEQNKNSVQQSQNQVVPQAFKNPKQQNNYQPNKQQNNVDNQESIQNQHATQFIHNQQFQQNNTNQQNRFPQNKFGEPQNNVANQEQFQNQHNIQGIKTAQNSNGSQNTRQTGSNNQQIQQIQFNTQAAQIQQKKLENLQPQNDSKTQEQQQQSQNFNQQQQLQQKSQQQQYVIQNKQSDPIIQGNSNGQLQSLQQSSGVRQTMQPPFSIPQQRTNQIQLNYSNFNKFERQG